MPLKTLSDWLNIDEEITPFRMSKVVLVSQWKTFEDPPYFNGSWKIVHEIK